MHTPGPYQLTSDDSDVWDENHRVVASCPYREVDESERQSNRRLFSAAPDLLAACETALKLLSNVRSVEYSNGASIGGYFPELALLQAAIAKAKKEAESGV